MRDGETYLEMTKQSGGDPAVPGLNRCQLYVRENRSGKTELRARFHTGAIQVTFCSASVRDPIE
jgi:hypothetical protein